MELRSNEKRAKNAQLLLWIIMSLEIILFISSYLQYDLLQRVQNGEMISQDAADLNDLREQILAFLYLIAMIVSAFTFIMWFRRGYYNIGLFTNKLSHKDSWAAGSWFIPIVSLYLPFQLMKQMFIETKKLLQSHEIDIKNQLNTKILGIWWSTWVVTNILGQIESKLSTNAETVDEFITVTSFSMVNSLISIPSAILALKIVADYSRISPLLFKVKEKIQNEENEGNMTLNNDSKKIEM